MSFIPPPHNLNPTLSSQTPPLRWHTFQPRYIYVEEKNEKWCPQKRDIYVYSIAEHFVGQDSRCYLKLEMLLFTNNKFRINNLFRINLRI